MPFLDDFKCFECGWEDEVLLPVRADELECPRCQKTAKKVFRKIAPYHMNIETYMNRQRGHLGPQIKRSMEREARIKASVAGRRALVRGKR